MEEFMKGSEKVIEGLNEALSEELSAINQYFLHAELCESWGYGKLAASIKKQSIDEMKHAEQIIERVLFFEGAPNMIKYRKLNIGQNVPDMIANDLKLEVEAVGMYNRLIMESVEAKDYGTAELFKKLLKDEEEHVNELEEMQSRISGMGLQNYLALQAVK
jgi:bacterioferritin